MATIVTMPQKGLSEESALIAEWHVKKGDRVKTGDELFSIEIGKATFSVESETEGVIIEIIGKEGDEIAIGCPVCIIGELGEKYKLPDKTIEHKEDKEQKSILKTSGKDSNNFNIDGDRVFISPRARELARKKGVDYSKVKATGPESRIIERDIRVMSIMGSFATDADKDLDIRTERESDIRDTITAADIESSFVKKEELSVNYTEDYRIQKNSRIRQMIADNMYHSLMSTAQLTINADFDATELLNLRKRIKTFSEANEITNITINDMVLFATARILTLYPRLNAHYLDNGIKIFDTVHLGVAVDTERGLMVPTIQNADKMTLSDIALVSKKLAEQCRAREIAPEKLSGGTFTVSNLGVYGVKSFTPIINPPQTGILGVCGVDWKVKVVNGSPKYYQAMGLSLTFDHRAIDGAEAARFLMTLRKNLENFSMLLVDPHKGGSLA